MSDYPSRKALITTRTVARAGERAFTEAFNLKACNNCINPNEKYVDQYGREAHPYSLKRYNVNCNSIDPYQNYDAVIARENMLDRPYLNPTTSSEPLYSQEAFDGFTYGGYDAMGVGRSMQVPIYGSCGGDNVFKPARGMAPSSHKMCNAPNLEASLYASPMSYPKSDSGCSSNGSLRSVFAQTYNG